MPKAAKPVDADDTPVSFEQAREELTAVVARLEAGGLSLEESLALWERGEQLAAKCLAILDAARTRIDAVPSSDD